MAGTIFDQYLQPVRSIQERMADLDGQDFRREQLTGARQQNALQALAMQRDAQTRAEADRDRTVLQTLASQSGGDQNALIKALRGSGRVALMGQADAIEKALLERQKAETDIEDKKASTLKTHFSALKTLAGGVMANPTIDSATFAIDAFERFTGRKMPEERARIAQLRTPEDIKRWAASHALDADKLLPQIQNRDIGGSVQTLAIDPLTGLPTITGAVDKTVTPDAVMVDKRTREEGAANRGVQIRGQNITREGLNLQRDAARSVVVETSEGPALLDKGTGKTTILTGPDGKPLGPKLKDAPAAVQKAMIENGTNLRRAEQALALVQGKDVGEAKGDTAATGLKGYLPNQLLNRIDPLGVDARAQIADLGSLVIHDRSGAAVTAAEFPRLAPFIPSEKDDAETVNKKLKRFVQVYKDEMAATQQAYGPESGYRQLGGAKPASDVAPKPAAGPAKPGTVLRFDANGKPVN